MINLINKYHTINCQRPGPLGNPFKPGQDGTREEVISKYKTYLEEQIKNKNTDICKALNNIYKSALKYNIQLECSCLGHHKECHIQVIKEIILNKAKNLNQLDLINIDKNDNL